MSRRLLFAVNGSASSAMGVRARGLAAGLSTVYEPCFLYRPAGPKLDAARWMAAEMATQDPALVYVLDMSVSGVLAALWHKLTTGTPVVIDTGDAITALARSAKLRGPAGIAATWLLEETGLRRANHIVVRGSKHRDILAGRGIHSTWIPDGYEGELFSPATATHSSGETTIGLLGSITWNATIEATYGWDLVETLALTPDLPLRGLLVGDGDGLARLKDYAHLRGVAERIEFTGRVPYEQLQHQIHRMDICLSTQTNDLPGQVRTTGKLPLYLACGRFILASRVGEAARLLPEEMLIDYEDSRDPAYPRKLADRLRLLLPRPAEIAAAGARLATDVAPQFEYRQLSSRLEELLDRL